MSGVQRSPAKVGTMCHSWNHTRSPSVDVDLPPGWLQCVWAAKDSVSHSPKLVTSPWEVSPSGSPEVHPQRVTEGHGVKAQPLASRQGRLRPGLRSTHLSCVLPVPPAPLTSSQFPPRAPLRRPKLGDPTPGLPQATRPTEAHCLALRPLPTTEEPRSVSSCLCPGRLGTRGQSCGGAEVKEAEMRPRTSFPARVSRARASSQREGWCWTHTGSPRI